MKNIIILFVILGGLVTSLLAQPETKIHTEKMKVFAGWPGTWKGTSTLQHGPGAAQAADVVETITYKLGETVLLIEGIGKQVHEPTQEEKVVHHALAILSYDPILGEYALQSHLASGQSTHAWFKVIADNNYQWGFEAGQVNVRYTIVLDPGKKTWREIGEYARDGGDWVKMFEMNLNKVE